MIEHLETVNEVNGYSFSNGSAGKRWKRGRKMISEGKIYTGGPYGEHKKALIVTNLDTGAMFEADRKTYEKFLTPECYKEWLLDSFTKI